MGKKVFEYSRSQYKGTKGVDKEKLEYIRKHIWKTSSDGNKPIEEEKISDFPWLVQIAYDIANAAPMIYAGMDAAPVDKNLTAGDALKLMKLAGVMKSSRNLCYTFVVIAKNGMVAGARDQYEERVKQEKRKAKSR